MPKTGDPRMTNALNLIIENPTMDYKDALIQSGYEFEDETSTKSKKYDIKNSEDWILDKDGISLTKRKLNLRFRVYHYKKNIHKYTNQTSKKKKEQQQEDDTNNTEEADDTNENDDDDDNNNNKNEGDDENDDTKNETETEGTNENENDDTNENENENNDDTNENENDNDTNNNEETIENDTTSAKKGPGKKSDPRMEKAVQIKVNDIYNKLSNHEVLIQAGYKFININQGESEPTQLDWIDSTDNSITLEKRIKNLNFRVWYYRKHNPAITIETTTTSTSKNKAKTKITTKTSNKKKRKRK